MSPAMQGEEVIVNFYQQYLAPKLKATMGAFTDG